MNENATTPRAEDTIERAASLLRDGASGYTSAAERIDDDDVRTALVEMGARRRVISEEVVRQAVESGVWVSHSRGSMEGIMQRAWLALEALIGDDLTVLRSVHEAEESTAAELSSLDLAGLPDGVTAAVRDGEDHVATCLAALDTLISGPRPT